MSGPHLPQPVPAFKQLAISLRVQSPRSIASQIWDSVTPLQMHTYINDPGGFEE